MSAKKKAHDERAFAPGSYPSIANASTRFGHNKTTPQLQEVKG